MSNDSKIIPMHPNKRGPLRKILALTAAAIVVLGIVALVLFGRNLNVDALRRWVRYWNLGSQDSTGLFEFDAHNSNRYANYNGGLAVASVGGLSTYQSDGQEAVVSQAQLAMPQIESCSQLVMAYDVGGSTLLAVNSRSGEVLRVTAEKAILDASLSQGGSLCYLSGASGYKSVLTVYNSSQECVYRWLSSTTYMPLCAIAKDGTRLAAVGLDQENGAFKSTLNLFRTDHEQIERTVDLGSELVYDLRYLSDDTICAVGETDVQFYTAEGESAGVYSYNGNYLKDFDLGGDGFLALSLNMYRAGSRYTLVTVDEAGQELASVYVGQEILSMSACGKYVAILTPEGVTVYDRSLEVYAQTAETGTATSVLMRKDGSVLLLGGGEGHLYIP